MSLRVHPRSSAAFSLNPQSEIRNPKFSTWLKFDASDTANTDDDVRDKTDAAGRFSLKILKGLKGELSSDMYARIGEFENCPKLDELIKKTGRDYADIKTTPLSIEADRNLYDIELTFPFPFCKKKE